MDVTIENICSDFFVCWEQAKACSFEEQLRLWKSLYEARHPALLESYYQAFLPLTQDEARVKRAFQQFHEVVPRMQQWAEKSSL